MNIDQRKEELMKVLRIDDKRHRIIQIKKEMEDPTFWQDHEEAAKITQEMTRLHEVVDDFEKVNDEKSLEKLEVQTLYDGKYDDGNAIISIHAGAGGTEAQDWSQILLRMYERYAGIKNYTFKITDESAGEEAGIKSATMSIEGFQAFGNLKSEAGVHRLVRISPFDSNKSRHTSFSLVEVTPQLKKGQMVEIDPKDIKMDFFRSGGSGGQNVNKVSTAVRVTHIPTGLVVASQSERAQAQNREIAMKILASKLTTLLEQQQKDKLEELKGKHISPEWGSQIRSYVLHPYQMVKDHRTNFETSNTTAVLNGQIDQFIESYLRYIKKEKISVK